MLKEYNAYDCVQYIILGSNNKSCYQFVWCIMLFNHHFRVCTFSLLKKKVYCKTLVMLPSASYFVLIRLILRNNRLYITCMHI